MVLPRRITLLCVSLLLTAVAASPVAHVDFGGLQKRDGDIGGGGKTCTPGKRFKRRAWQDLSKKERKAYLDAELCLMRNPTKTGLTAAVSRFDDLIKSHQLQSLFVHNDGWFLPFHRLLIHAHEKLLRDECGYKGTQPYWEETLDVGRTSQSEILDPVYGFGGGGTGPGGCIETGPFRNYTLHTGPGPSNTVHCIIRKINETESYGASPANITRCMQKETYAQAWPCLELWPHFAGHNSIGGEMANPISSPGDPIFYLHHAWLDKQWWNWQERDLTARLTDIAGYTSMMLPPTGWVNATLDDTLNMYGVIANATIRDVMNIQGKLLCVEYVDYGRKSVGPGHGGHYDTAFEDVNDEFLEGSDDGDDGDQEAEAEEAAQDDGENPV